MSSKLPPAAQRVLAVATAAGIAVDVREMPASTRTAAEAAGACGCAVAQIVKSLVFRGEASGRPYLLLVAGSNRVDEKSVAATIGEALTRPDADYVREVTGYAIGGIPPFGHATALAAYIDRDLLAFDEVWAAAGTPHCVMRLTPGDLKRGAGAIELTVRATG
jgi:prolyl-tRNA editing enzyme YbaK/EbsC (Cys-tRNA(Pro) deacylase)